MVTLPRPTALPLAACLNRQVMKSPLPGIDAQAGGSFTIWNYASG